MTRFNPVIKWIDSEKLFKEHEVVGNNNMVVNIKKFLHNNAKCIL